jgi:hypothetical protein
MTIEQFCVTMLKKGKSAKETLELSRKVFPSSNTSIKCIYYYSSKHKIGLSRKVEIDQDALKEALAA